MRLAPRILRLMLRAFPGNELKFILLLLNSPAGPYWWIRSLWERSRDAWRLNAPPFCQLKTSWLARGSSAARSPPIRFAPCQSPLTKWTRKSLPLIVRCLKFAVTIVEQQPRLPISSTTPVHARAAARKLFIFVPTVIKRITINPSKQTNR